MQSRDRPTVSGFWKLKLRYQFLLLWFPVLAFLAGTVAGMYLTGIALAPSLGINIQEPIVGQPNGGRFFWSIMSVGIVSGSVLSAIGYFAVLLTLAAQLQQSWRHLWQLLLADKYPSAWL
jgi:hypothetical protein